MPSPGVYILCSAKDGSYYIGSTDDIAQRLHQHNRGWVVATRYKIPYELATFIVCANLTEARKAEYRLKKYKRRDILEKVIQDKTFPWNFKRA